MAYRIYFNVGKHKCYISLRGDELLHELNVNHATIFNYKEMAEVFNTLKYDNTIEYKLEEIIIIKINGEEILFEDSEAGLLEYDRLRFEGFDCNVI